MYTKCIHNAYMSSSVTLRKPLGVRATPAEHELITQAAQREKRSVNSFVLRAALQAGSCRRQRRYAAHDPVLTGTARCASSAATVAFATP